MKLSEKGIQKVLDDVFLICDEETGYIVKHWMPTEDFEPDDFDFDGVVIMPVYDAKILTNDKFVSDYFENALTLLPLPKQLSNWIMTEVLRVLKDNPTENLNDIISAKNLTDIIKAVEDKKLTRPNSKALFELVVSKTLAKESADAMEIAKDEGMLISFSEEELVKIVEEVLVEFKDAMKDFDKTPEKVVRFYIGKVMQKSKGLANPQLTQTKIITKIGK